MPQVFCKDIGRVKWESSSPGLVLSPGMIDCWRIPVLATGWFDTLLLPEEMENARRYYRREDQLRFMTGRGSVRYLLGSYAGVRPLSIRLAEGVNKKPFAVGSPLHYNVSHSGNWVLIAFSTSQVGVDVERMDQEFDFEELVPMNFSTSEAEVISGATEPRTAFYRFWTRKEALLKATSVGLVDNLPAITVLDGIQSAEEESIGSPEAWAITSFGTDNEHMGSIAFQPGTEIVRFRQLDTTISGL